MIEMSNRSRREEGKGRRGVGECVLLEDMESFIYNLRFTVYEFKITM
jgi:hypothetical protein